MKELYRLKNLAVVGVIALVAVVFWLVVAVCIPTFRATETTAQLYTIRHQELRDNNPLYTDLLLESIQRNNGYLVLGTSESNPRPKGNYFDFLNTDTAIHCGFSVIAGAGRTSCTYFPLIQSNANVKGLKVIVFLNPAYCCNKLAVSNADYFNRYVSYTAYKRANKPKNQDVANILKTNKRQIFFVDRVGDCLEFYLDRLRRKYYQDLRFRLDSSQFEANLTWLDSAAISRMPKSCDRPDSSRYNYCLNVASGFDVRSYTLYPHPEESYRYDELRTMIRLCKEREMDVIFVAGPYNSIAYQKMHPSELPRIQEVSKKMLQVLEVEGAAYIDCTDLSTEPGVFADWQHHTSYGGYLIYQKIRDYVLEKENR
jgi:hypothetical protein